MKWYIIILITLLLTPFIYGLEECQRVTDVEDIPCTIITTWQYPGLCSDYSVNIYNQSGEYLETINLTERGSSGFCEFTFNQSVQGTYVYNVTSGDTGTIVVGVDDYMIGIIIAVAFIVAILLWFAFMLSDEHVFLKYLIVIISIGFLTLIPSVFIIKDVSTLFYKYYMWFIKIIAIYTFIYLVYKMLVYFGAIVPGENKNND